MSDNQNQPREYDAVLGGQNPPPILFPLYYFLFPL
jgi:hypothetical protein